MLIATDIIQAPERKSCGFSSLTRSLLQEEQAKNFFISFKIINFSRGICLVCKAFCIKTKDESLKAGFNWTCLNKKCGKIFNPLQSTIFENCNISYSKVADLLIHWFFRQSFDLTVVDCQVSEPTVARWLKLFRKICHEANQRNSVKIGGPGQWVEVDEAHLFRRKYNRGRRVKGESIWLFGGICRETKQRFVVRVPNRTKRTLWGVLRKNVHTGTILVTDGYKSYAGVKEALGFLAHEIVIHKDGFVNDLFREVFTNTIECVWSKIKKKVRNSGTLQSVDLHIGEFLYRTRLDLMFGRKYYYGQKLQIFLRDMKKCYPGLSRT